MNTGKRETRLVMYMHAGSGNHGCEAIVNSLCGMIKEKPVLLSYFGNEDNRYSLKDLCDIVQERRFSEHRLAHVLYYAYRLISKDKESFIRYRYAGILKKMSVPLAISIGGDNYCYETMLNDLMLANHAFNRKGTKTVLLGCSIEPELLGRKEILSDLGKYHTIISRESITDQALRTAFGKKDHPKLLCFPDPAFLLEKKEPPLPAGFNPDNTIGINVSPMIQGNEAQPGITMKCYYSMIRYIINHTDSQIALIPHVVWERNDDRLPIHELYEAFQETGRVVEIEDGSCQELKGYISRCRMFIGARTHATIAAYSSGVPTLVVGYSVKARGIAKDLFGTDENYVIPVQSLQHPEDLVKGLLWLMENEEDIRSRLTQVMPAYKEKALQTGKEVDRIWEEFNQQPKI